MICWIYVKYAYLVHLLHFHLPLGANFQKCFSKGSILPRSACTCREKRSGKEGKHPSTSTSSLLFRNTLILNNFWVLKTFILVTIFFYLCPRRPRSNACPAGGRVATTWCSTYSPARTPTTRRPTWASTTGRPSWPRLACPRGSTDPTSTSQCRSFTHHTRRGAGHRATLQLIRQEWIRFSIN